MPSLLASIVVAVVPVVVGSISTIGADGYIARIAPNAKMANKKLIRGEGAHAGKVASFLQESQHMTRGLSSSDTTSLLSKLADFKNVKWENIYRTDPHAPQQLPKCASDLKVFVYDLPSAYNSDLLTTLEKQRRNSPCDAERGPCQETARDPEYSCLRNYNAEVDIVAKFLLMPQITEDPEEADIFVVPWFASADFSRMKLPWGGGTDNPTLAQQVTARVDEVIAMLPHFQDPSKQGKHIFFCSHGRRDVKTALLDRVHRAGATLMHYGPTDPETHDAVVVPNAAGHGMPLQPLQHPATHFAFLMAGKLPDARAHSYHMRALMEREVDRLKAQRPDLNVVRHNIEDHRAWDVSPTSEHDEMTNSLVCPMPQGDTPGMHRIFDALASGCLPLFVTYHHQQANCDMWGWDDPTWLPTPCQSRAFPFTSFLDYRNISVQVDGDKFKDGSFAEALMQLDRQELEAKRKHLESIRSMFVYDWSGNTYDAFSSLMQELCTKLPHLQSK